MAVYGDTSYLMLLALFGTWWYRVIIGILGLLKKSGDLVGCHRSVTDSQTDRQTTKYSLSKVQS